VAEAKEQAHAGWVATLAPLKDAKRFTLATLGEIKVEDKPALGVKVSRQGPRDVDLYFDKRSGLLVRTEWPASRTTSPGQEVTEESSWASTRRFRAPSSR
jgi:hypothetical protein